MTAASPARLALRERHSSSAGLMSFGFERLAMLLLPIMETVSTFFNETPLFNGLKTALFAGLFGIAAILANPPRDMRRSLLRCLLLALGLYTLISRLAYLGTAGAPLPSVIGALMGSLALLWLLNTHLSPSYFRSIMTWFVVGSAIAGIISSALSLQILLDSGARGWARVSTEVSSNRNAVAPIYVIALSAILFLRLNMSRSWTMICGGSILVATLLLFSRSGYIAILILMVMAAAANSRTRKAVVPFLIVMGLAVTLPGSPILDRIDYTFEGRGANALDDSAATRIDIWQAAFKEFESHPFFGSGSGKSPFPSYDSRHEEIIYDHNYFITQISQLGVIGFFITISVIISFFMNSYNQDNDLKYFSITSLFVIISTSLTGEPLYGLTIYILYIISIIISNKSEYNCNSVEYS